MSRGQSDMRSEPIDEALLVKYLLGSLTEEEQADVEDRTFANPDFLIAVEAAEADLIDAYVRGDFSETERRSFEQRFLVSPERRKKVASRGPPCSSSRTSQCAPALRLSKPKSVIFEQARESCDVNSTRSRRGPPALPLNSGSSKLRAVLPRR